MEPYACDGVVVDFIFDFRIFAAGDLLVYLDDTLLTYGTHYEVFKSGGTFLNGGTVQTLEAHPAGSTITIIRQINISSVFDVEESGPLPSAMLEDGFDRLAMICLQLAAKVGRGIVLPILEESTMELPTVADRASKFLFFGADGSIEMKGLAELGAVTADESSIVLTSDVLSIKDGGVTLVKLAQEVLDYITAEAGAVVDIHDAAENPHPGKFEAAGAAASAVGDHEAADNPHSQYTNKISAWGVVKKDGTKLIGSSNWTVSRNSQGNYQLNITDSGDYMLITTLAEQLNADEVNAIHSDTTGKFANNTASNIVVARSGDFVVDEDSAWSFIAIKL